MKLRKYLIEMEKLEKKKWTVVSLNDLDKKTRHRLWDMYTDTYQNIGLHIENISNLTSKYKVSWLIDIDKDSQIDAFIIYKETKHGNKLALMGSDGKKENKEFLIKKFISLLKTKGWFVEASHKVSDILLSNNIKIVTDMNLIKKIIGKEKFVEQKKNGEYKRKLGTLGVVKKRMFGYPK